VHLQKPGLDGRRSQSESRRPSLLHGHSQPRRCREPLSRLRSLANAGSCAGQGSLCPRGRKRLELFIPAASLQSTVLVRCPPPPQKRLCGQKCAIGYVSAGRAGRDQISAGVQQRVTCTSSAAFSRRRWVSRASRSRRVRSRKSCLVSWVRDLFLPLKETYRDSGHPKFAFKKFLQFRGKQGRTRTAPTPRRSEMARRTFLRSSKNMDMRHLHTAPFLEPRLTSP
jgi:hypothetical protein